jgi:hypothetical protein
LNGGGIFSNTGATSLRSVAVLGNTSTAPTTGAGIAAAGGTVNVGSVLLSNNRVASPSTEANCATNGAGTITTSGFNLSDDATCTSLSLGTDKPNTAAGVSPTLADNGGPTKTHALLTGSAAINSGNPATCPSTDQRGVARQDACDIGAFEFVTASGSFRSVMAPGVSIMQFVPKPPGKPAMAPARDPRLAGLGPASR